MKEIQRPVICVEELTKIYPTGGKALSRRSEGKLAVDCISFEVHKGEIFGLLGPNGAGKTTTIKMLTTLLLPTSGSAAVLGSDVVAHPMEIRKRINLVSGGERGLYYRITGRQNLLFFSDLYQVPARIKKGRVDDLLRIVGLEEAADTRVEDYSRGMKQRLHIARGLVNDPEILFLDEPTIGLDPEIAREVREIIRGMSVKGKTILLTTHYMHEAEEMCSRIGLISKGRIIALGAPSELKELVKTKSAIEIEAGYLPAEAIESIRNLEGVKDVHAMVQPDRSVVRVLVEEGSNMMGTIATALDGYRLNRISNEEPTLEDAYLSLVSDDD